MSKIFRLLVFIVFVLINLSLNAQSFNFVGDSYSIGEDCYVLTPAQTWQNGAIWYNESININEPFNLQFTANFGDDDAGADGLVFVLQQVSSQILGASGGGMGFGGFSPSLGVEFDTFQNIDLNDPNLGNNDPVYDHVAIAKNGNSVHGAPNSLAEPIQISPISDNVEDGQFYVVDIAWDPSTGIFSVSVNCELRIEIALNMTLSIFTNNPQVFWGFTGATGGLFNEQIICVNPIILGLPEIYYVCENTPIQLQAPASTLGTISWEPAEFLDDPNSPNPIATIDENTTFTLTFEDLCGNQQVQQTTLIITEPNIDLGPDISECISGSYTLTAEGEYNDITWFNGSSESTVQVSESGVYWAEVSLLGGCQATDSVEVEIFQNPQYFGNLSVEICEGEEFFLNLPSNDLTVTWFDGSNNASRTFENSGSYSFQISNNNCSASFEIDIEILPTPSFDLGPDISICENTSTTLSVPLSEGVNVIWSNTNQTNEIEVFESGVYWATANNNGCIYSDTIVVNYFPTANLSISGSEVICPNQEIILTAETDAEVLWSTGEITNEILVNAPGDYSLVATDINGCLSESSITLNAISEPEIQPLENVIKCRESSVVVKTESSDNENLIWSTGDLGSEIRIDEIGTYSVELSNNCGIAIQSFTVEEEDCLDIYFLPNAFTPNNDGINDTYKAFVRNYVSFELLIFNRHGGLVFKTNNPEISWNGKYFNSGYNCEAGVYNVKVTVDFGRANIKQSFGTITLVR